MTRSTKAMSIPSSRELVATNRSQPAALQVFLDQLSSLLGNQAMVGARQLLIRELVKRPQSRSARRRELTNTIVLLCSEMSSTK